MGIQIPGKRPGKRLEGSKVLGSHALRGKKSVVADLLVTPLVDMFVIIVLFLIANFSATGDVLYQSNELVLPEAKNVLALQVAPVVVITKTEVLLSGAPIGRIEDFIGDDYLNIPPLEEGLRDAKTKFENLHAAAGDASAFRGDVNIQADKSVEFRIVKRVMFSCAAAGFGNVNFATVDAGEGATSG
jgi:biopolymer transport protein ExbD